MKTIGSLLIAILICGTPSVLVAADGKAKKENLSALAAQFDVDGDGKLSADEKAAMKAGTTDKAGGRPRRADAEKKGSSKAGARQKALAEFDANGNGKLDPDEQVAARQAAAMRRKNKKLAKLEAANQPFDVGNGVGGLNNQPLGPAGGAGPRGDGRAKLMERFDMNRDGRLDEQEMAKADEFIRNRQHGATGGLPRAIGGRKAK